MTDFLSWIPWIGGMGMIGYVLLAIFAQPLLTVITTTLSNFIPPLKDAIVWYIKDVVWGGVKTIFTNVHAVILVASLMLATGWWYSTPQRPTVSFCKPVIDQLHKEYKFIPKKNTTSPSWNIFPRFF